MKTKLVKCKSCGADIAKTASKCPQCGAKQHQAALTACVLIIIFAAILCAVILIRSGSPSSAGTPDPTLQISAVELRAAYDENTVNADNLYKGKTIAVTGTIADITQDIVSKNPCVSLISGDSLGIYTVQCFFGGSEEEKNQIAALKDGDSVTIIGQCSGRPLTNVQLTRCSLTE